jgi:uncharacterized alkaline shock family protein YloU
MENFKEKNMKILMYFNKIRTNEEVAVVVTVNEQAEIDVRLATQIEENISKIRQMISYSMQENLNTLEEAVVSFFEKVCRTWPWNFYQAPDTDIKHVITIDF